MKINLHGPIVDEVCLRMFWESFAFLQNWTFDPYKIIIDTWWLYIRELIPTSTKNTNNLQPIGGY